MTEHELFNGPLQRGQFIVFALIASDHPGSRAPPIDGSQFRFPAGLFAYASATGDSYAVRAWTLFNVKRIHTGMSYFLYMQFL